MANILDLPSDEFHGYLKELEQYGEDPAKIKWLEEQYRNKTSVGSSILTSNEQTQKALGEEGRRTLGILPFSKETDARGIVDSVKTLRFEPKAWTEQMASGAIRGFNAPAQALAGNTQTLSDEEKIAAANETAGLMAGGSSTIPAPKGSLRLFGGPSSKTYPKANEERAIAMRDAGYRSHDIWRTEGMEYSPHQKQWQYEIDNSGFTIEHTSGYKDQGLLDLLHQNFEHHGKADSGTKLSNVTNFPELYKAYPNLKGTELLIKDKLGNGGYFDGTTNTIVIGPEVLKSVRRFRDVVLHELQHGIQAHEGTIGGSSTEYLVAPGYGGRFFSPIKDIQDKLDSYNKAASLAEREYTNRTGAYVTFDKLLENKDSFNMPRLKNLITKAEDIKLVVDDLASDDYMRNVGEVEARAAAERDKYTQHVNSMLPPSVSYQDELNAYGLSNVPGSEMTVARMSHTYAEGGQVSKMGMQDQMKQLVDGGIATSGQSVDPVSGNSVPPGSLPHEVRDDVPAQLSDGEYVVPADVVRYFGVRFFEDLRTQAKDGLSQMEQDGRIGGEPVGPTDGKPVPNLSELSDDQSAELADMLDTGMASGGLLDTLSDYAKYDHHINSALNNQGYKVGYAGGGTVQSVYQNPTQADALVKAVVQAVSNNPTLLQELAKRGILANRVQPQATSQQIKTANNPTNTTNPVLLAK